MHVHVCRKDDSFWQRRLNDSGVGGGIAFIRVYLARAYTTLVVLVFWLQISLNDTLKKSSIIMVFMDTFKVDGALTQIIKS